MNWTDDLDPQTAFLIKLAYYAALLFAFAVVGAFYLVPVIKKERERQATTNEAFQELNRL